jgi:hypothetical protein
MEQVEVVSTGIKETTEALDAVVEIISALGHAKSDDGVIDRMEVLKAFVTTAPSSIRGIAGANEIVLEVKDLSREEIEVIAGKALQILEGFRKLMGA